MLLKSNHARKEERFGGARQASTSNLRDGSYQVAGNTNIVQHCAICWATIARYAETHGYRSSDDTWICESCYKRYVLTGSIDFML